MKTLIATLLLLSFNSFASTSLSWIYDSPNKPLNIKTVNDQQVTTQAKIGVMGGSLSVTASDGTIFTLDIPENALFIDTAITMSSVKSLDGMTFGSNPLAVNFEPSGLVLRLPAILTIKSSKPIPVENQIFFDFENTGDNLNLAVPVVDSREIKMKVFHFSGYGVTLGYMSDFDALREQMGKNTGEKIHNALAEKLSKQRTRDLIGHIDGSEDVYQDIEAGLNEYYEKVLKQRLALLEKSSYTCQEGRFAQESAITFTRNAQLAGFSNIHRELDSLVYIKDLDRKCMKEEYLACRDNHIIHRLIPLHQMWIRNRIFAGQEDPQLDAEEEDYIHKCMQFEVEFNDITQSTMNNPQFFYTLFARYKIAYTDNATVGQEEISGHGELAVTNFSGKFTNKDCSMTTAPGPAGMTKVNQLRFVYGKKNDYDPIGMLEDIKLGYHPGNTNEVIKISCQGHEMPAIPPQWFAFFVGTHIDEFVKVPDGDKMSGMVMRKFKLNINTELVAEKTWNIVKQQNGIKDEGSLRIYHKPE
jgi:hypothetical protein